MKEDDCGLGKNGKRIRLTGFRSRRRRRRQNEDDFVTGRKQRQSIAQLLYDRECGRNSTNFLKQAPLYEEWKPFVCRNIPFSKLQTPFTDAIISLDSNGSYMMSLGGTSIRFYGRALLIQTLMEFLTPFSHPIATIVAFHVSRCAQSIIAAEKKQ